MKTGLNFSLVGNPAPMLHKPDCPEVDKARKAGKPILTMFDCEKAPPDDMPRCHCLVQQ